MDNGFKLLSPSIASSLSLSENTVSLQATLPGILEPASARSMYAALSDSISIRKLMIFAVIIMSIGSMIGFALQGSFGGILLTGRIIQTCGLATRQALYVIWAASTSATSRKSTWATAPRRSSCHFCSGRSAVVHRRYVGWTAFFL